MKQLVNEFRQMAEDAWRRVHRLFIVDDEWKLERDVDDISVYSQYSDGLGKILKLEVSYWFCVRISGTVCTVDWLYNNRSCMLVKYNLSLQHFHTSIIVINVF